jgi:hypothetical protein
LDAGYEGDFHWQMCECEGGTANAHCETKVVKDQQGHIVRVDCIPNGCNAPAACNVLPIGTGPAATCQCK